MADIPVAFWFDMPFPIPPVLFAFFNPWIPTIWGKTSPCLRTFLLLKNLPESLLGIAITHVEDPSKIFKQILKKCPSQSRMSFGCGKAQGAMFEHANQQWNTDSTWYLSNGTTCTFELWNWASFKSRCSSHTVDGRNPAPVEVGSLSHSLQGFKYIPGG